MTEQELAAIEALAKAAKRGPMVVKEYGGEWHVLSDMLDSPHNWFCECGSEDDALFVAAAFQSAPALVAEVRRLRALVRDAYKDGWNTRNDWYSEWDLEATDWAVSDTKRLVDSV